MLVLPSRSRAQAVSPAADETKTNSEIAKAATERKPKDDDKPANDASAQLSPAQIADQIEETWKRYEAVEYTATVEETRNANSFSPGKEPLFVTGTGSVHFMSHGNRWFVDEKSFIYQGGTADKYPWDTVSAFDGTAHSVFDRRKLVIGEEDLTHVRLIPRNMFWEAGLTAEWLLTALRRPEAKILERIKLEETFYSPIEVKWTPEWDTVQWSFEILVCREEGWLPRQVAIQRGGKTQAEWLVREVRTTVDGLCYPAKFQTKCPDTSPTPSRTVRITSFRERTNFTPDDFVIPVPFGIDIVDRRRGLVWHTDPWREEMAPWMLQNVGWQIPESLSLEYFRQMHNPRRFGMAAPPLNPGDWPTHQIPLNWDRPERKLTILFFFSGRLISPTPALLKALDHLHQRYADGGLEVIAVVPHGESLELIQQSIKELNLTIPVMRDSKATESQIKSKADGANWGSIHAAYRLKSDSGFVVVDGSGKIDRVDLNLIANGFTTLEAHVRKKLFDANGTADPPTLRRMQVNRTSGMLRGSAAQSAELDAAMTDPSAQWLENAQQRIADTIPVERMVLFKSNGLTVQSLLKELNEDVDEIQGGRMKLVEEEWYRRASETPANCLIRGSIRHDDGSRLKGCQAALVVQPFFIMASFNVPGGRWKHVDRSRIRNVETDSNGQFVIEKLQKGAYELSISAPGIAKSHRTIYLADNESKADLSVVLTQRDSILGKVTDASGIAVSNAKVKAIQRYQSPDNPQSPTSEHLPNQPATTGRDGEFVFESLFEGSYVFEVIADGFELMKTEKISAGTADAKIILKPRE